MAVEVELGKDRFGIDILNILGIPSRGARKIVLTVEVDDIARVEVERFLHKDEAQKIKELMKEHYVFDVIDRGKTRIK